MEDGEEQKAHLEVPRTGGVVHSCTKCKRDIWNESYVCCTICKNMILCLECYSVGSYCRRHLPTHPVVIFDPYVEPIFREDWTAEEEMLLIEAIIESGVGNWADVATRMKCKTAAQCETHFQKCYIESPTAPYPRPELLPPDELLPEPSFPTTPINSMPCVVHDPGTKTKNGSGKSPGFVSRYMPFRGEFDETYLPNAEDSISGVAFRNDDTPEAFAEKLKTLKVYHKAVRERAFRTRVAIEWGVDNAAVTGLDAKTPEELEFERLLLPLAPMLGRSTIENVMKSIKSNLAYRTNIETRQRWISEGITTVAEGMLFQGLEALVKDGKIPQANIDEWCRRIDEYNRTMSRIDLGQNKFLTHREKDLCTYEGISSQLYVIIKDLIVREFMIRGPLKPEDLAGLSRMYSREVQLIYELLKSVGIVL